MLRDSLFFLEIFAKLLTIQCPNVFSTWIITYIKLGVSHLWEKFQDEIVHQRTFTKKAPNFFWLFVKDMNIPYIFYKIQNFQGTPWASIIATCLIKLLRMGPLIIFTLRNFFIHMRRPPLAYPHLVTPPLIHKKWIICRVFFNPSLRSFGSKLVGKASPECPEHSPKIGAQLPRNNFCCSGEMLWSLREYSYQLFGVLSQVYVHNRE